MRPDHAPALAELQRTLMRALYAPPGARSKAALRRAARWASPLPQAGPADALALYRRMGALRFEREVAREFPALRAWLGDARFSALARAFVARRRSRSFSLDGYAETLPRFLATTRVLASARERGGAQALASFEVALRRAARAWESAPGTKSPPSAALIPAAGARLLELGWDAPAAYGEWRRTGAITRIERRRTRVAVFARDARAVWLEIGAREAALLASLLRGTRVGPAVALAVRTGLSAARVRAAFERWVAGGLLVPKRQ